MEKQQVIINEWKCSSCGETAVMKIKKKKYCSVCASHQMGNQAYRKTKDKAIVQEEQTQKVSRLHILQSLNLTEEELHLLSSK